MHLSSDNRVGWNKFWQGSELLVWFGSITFKHPLRLIALEIESIPNLNTNLRNYLTRKYYEDHIGKEEQMEKLLSMYGLASFESKISRHQLLLLQRLNTDQRERPMIERWRWSKDSGIAYLSDGGQVQISLNLAWSRAVENSLYRDYSHSLEIKDFMSNIKPDQSNIALPTDIGEGVVECLNTIRFYGLGHGLGRTFQLKVPAGEFPGTFSSLTKEELHSTLELHS